MYKFLVVEDDDTIQLIIKRLLTKNFQCQITTASNGVEALKKLEEELPDLILLDVTMPVMNGIATLKAIREDNRLNELPVIMLTAINDKASVSSVLTKGISDYILKPINFSVDADRIRNVLNQSKLRKVGGGKLVDETQKEKILLIDKDQTFRTFITALLSNNFIVIEAPNSVEGLTTYVEKKPQYILITEKQEILNEKILAQKVKNNPEKNFKGIFLLRENLINDHIAQTYFTGVIKKTTVKHEFLRSFSQSLFNNIDLFILIKEIIKDNLAEEIISEVQQYFRDHYMKEITAQIEDLTHFNNWNLKSTASLIEPESKTILHIKIYSNSEGEGENIDDSVAISHNELYSLMSTLITDKLIKVFNNAQIHMSKTDSNREIENVDIENRHQLNIQFCLKALNYIGLSIICEKTLEVVP
ncbi:MAG: response regulator [Ignavibacteria bacterium]|nr:response regulator [Ignavibacteria bacterium]